MNINIDIAIFVGFLALNLIVGLTYGKGVNTIKDYALGGRNFSTGAIVATVVATWVSGSSFFIIMSRTYSDGLYYVFAASGMGMGFLLTAFFVVPRMEEFLGRNSVAEAIGDLYGRRIRIITAIAGIIAEIGLIAVQYKVFGNVFNYFLGFPSNVAMVLAGAIVTMYSAFGGIRAVTYTDVLQFITFGIGIPLVAILIWDQLYNVEGFAISNALNVHKFNFNEVFSFSNPRFWEMLPLFLYYLIIDVDAVIYQRISIGRSLAQVKKAFIISGILIILFGLMIAWVPFLIYNIDPNIKSNELVGYIIDNYTYTGLKGIIIIGVTAMAMSTADSRINVSAVMFANDICHPLKIGLNRELLLSKIFAFLLGIFAILMAITAADLLSIILMAQSFYMPIVTVPFMLAIFGFRSTEQSVLIGMAAGFITVIIWAYLEIDMDCIIFGMLVNLIFFMGSHYLLKQPGGWIEKSKKISHVKKEKFEVRNIKKLINKTTHNFIKFCKEIAPQNDLMYMGLGIYCLFYTFTTMYSTHVRLLTENSKIILTIYQIMICTSTLLAMYPIWPPKVKKEIIVQVSWNIIIFYMLIFFSCFFVMVSNFGHLQFVVFTLNIVMTAVLVGWKLGLGMTIVGFYLSAQFYKYYTGIESLDLSIGSPQFIFMYSLMLVGSALVIFIKPRQEYQALTKEKNEHLSGRITGQRQQVKEALGLKAEFIRNVEHEYHAPMAGIISNAGILSSAYDKLTDKQRKSAIDDIYTSSIRLKRFDDNITTLAKLSQKIYDLNLVSFDFSELLYSRIELCRKLYEEDKEAR